MQEHSGFMAGAFDGTFIFDPRLRPVVELIGTVTPSVSPVFMQVVQPIQMDLVTLAPALLLGLTGGLLAALFARLNTFICKRRTLLIAKIPYPLLQRFARILETVLIVVCTFMRLMSTAAMILTLSPMCECRLRSDCYNSGSNL